MKIYFLSSQPCLLTLNGAYFGRTDLFERFVELSPKDNVYAKFSPQGAGDIGFFINESLRFSPPDGCDVYLLKDGVAVYANRFPPTDFSLRVITQARLNDTLVTVYQQGEIQVSVESAYGLFNATLPHGFFACKVIPFENLIVLEGENTVAIFNEKGEQLLCENVLSYEIHEDVFSAVLPLSDRLNRTAECAWKYENSCLSQIQFTLRQSGTNPQDTQAELLPYAFFESVLIGADFAPFLSEELQKKSDFLKDFLGDFISVIVTDTPNVCGLVYRKAERLFDVRYFTATVENGKIADISG